MMNAFRRVVSSTLLLAAVSFSSTSLASGIETEGPRWACWYESSSLTIRCLLSRAPSANHEVRASEVSRTADKRLPQLVHTIWGNPEKLAADQISIPLGSIPYEMDFTAQLAKSVMCGARADCSVNFDANPDGRAPLRAAAVQAGASEAEVMAEMAQQGYVLAAVMPAVTSEQKTTRRRRV